MRSIDTPWESEEAIYTPDFCSAQYKQVLFSHNNSFPIPIIGTGKKRCYIADIDFLISLGYGDGVYFVDYLNFENKDSNRTKYFYEVVNGKKINYACCSGLL